MKKKRYDNFLVLLPSMCFKKGKQFIYPVCARPIMWSQSTKAPSDCLIAQYRCVLSERCFRKSKEIPACLKDVPQERSSFKSRFSSKALESAMSCRYLCPVLGNNTPMPHSGSFWLCLKSIILTGSLLHQACFESIYFVHHKSLGCGVLRALGLGPNICHLVS